MWPFLKTVGEGSLPRLNAVSQFGPGPGSLGITKQTSSSVWDSVSFFLHEGRTMLLYSSVNDTHIGCLEAGRWRWLGMNLCGLTACSTGFRALLLTD